MADAGVLGSEESQAIARFNAGAEARAEPVTRTKAICMANERSDNDFDGSLSANRHCQQCGNKSKDDSEKERFGHPTLDEFYGAVD